MAYEIKPWSYTVQSNIDLSTQPYRVVGLTTAGKLTWPTAGGAIIGVCQGIPNSSEAGEVLTVGISKVAHDGTVTPNDIVVATTKGYVTPESTSNQHVVGVALDVDGSASTGDLITVLLMIGGLTT